MSEGQRGAHALPPRSNQFTCLNLPYPALHRHRLRRKRRRYTPPLAPPRPSLASSRRTRRTQRRPCPSCPPRSQRRNRFRRRTHPDPNHSRNLQPRPSCRTRTILIEDVYDEKVGKHQHIDMIYFCHIPGPRPTAPDGWVWFTADDLSNGRAATNPDGISEPPPEDVVTLGLEGIHAAA